MEKPKFTIYEILDYEVKANIIAPYISNKFLQSIIAWYIGRKVKRKYNRYIKRTIINKDIKDGK